MFRQDEAEEVRNSNNKIYQTWSPLFSPTLYLVLLAKLSGAATVPDDIFIAPVRRPAPCTMVVRHATPARVIPFLLPFPAGVVLRPFGLAMKLHRSAPNHDSEAEEQDGLDSEEEQSNLGRSGGMAKSEPYVA